MTNENKDTEYIKVVADILESEMSLKPTPPTSTNPQDRRVFIYNQSFVLPNYDYMFLVLSENPGKPMAVRSKYDYTTDKEIQELLIQKQIEVDVMSRNAEARQRKEEVLMALSSIYSQQKQEENGFRVFSYSTLFNDVSEVEGTSRLNRYRATINLHVKYTKIKTAGYYNNFPLDNILYN